MLIAFDASSSTGVAWGTDQHRAPVPALWKLAEGDLDRALCQLRQQAMTLFQATKAQHVAIEETMSRVDRFHGAGVLIVLKSYEAVLREAATRHGAKVHMVKPQSWRATFLGAGNMKRDAAKRGAIARCKQLRWDFLDSEDTAEACALFYHMASKLWPRWRPA